MTRFCICAGLASPVDLNRKRKQVAEISCKTCGRPLVEGIGRPSASMLSTVGVELTNFINTELTWKTVTKGVRSGSRRCRKPARSSDMGVQLDGESMKREDSSVSDSEKIGVAVLGRHFADKVEHIPLKKRRLLLWSPSPPTRTPSTLHEEALSSQPQSPSPQPEDSEQTIDSKCASGQRCSDPVSNLKIGEFNGPVELQFSQGIENGCVNRELSEINGKLNYNEDFSGIALLAAAACHNSTSHDAHNVKEVTPVEEFLTPEGIKYSLSASSLERTTSSSEMCSLLIKDSTDEDYIDDSSFQDYSVSLSQNSHNKRDCEGKRPPCMKYGRLHWDLNTVMEAWELPFDDLNSDSQINGTNGMPGDVICSERAFKLEGGVISRDPEHALEQLKYSTADTEVFTDVVNKDKSLDNSLCSGSDDSDPISSRTLSDVKINTSSTNAVMRKREDCCGTSAMQHGEATSIENVHLGKPDLVLLDHAVSEKVMREIDSVQTKEDKPSRLPDNGTSPTEVVSTATCQKSDFKYSEIKSSNAGTSHPSPEHENLSASGTTLGESQYVAAVDMEEKQDKEAPAADATPMDSSLRVEPKELMSMFYECYPTDYGYGSDISLGGHGHLIGFEKMSETQAGYESPVEDGELRESLVCSWEENEVEGETECVDYDSDNRDAGDFDTANCCMSEVGSDSCQNLDNGSLAEKVVQDGRANVVKESSHVVSLEKSSSQDKFPEGCECSTNKIDKVIDVGTPKVLTSDSIDGFKGSSAGEVGSSAARAISSSHIEGPSCSDELQKKNGVYMHRSRSSYDSCFRAGRVFGSEKSLGRDSPILQMQDGSRGNGHRVDSSGGYWDSRNHYPNGYHAPHGTEHPNPRSGIANYTAKVDGLPYHDQRQSINYSSKGVYRPVIRRRSPSESGDAYSMHRRKVAVRNNSRFMSRGRSGIYRPGVIRGPRQEYNGPISDNRASSSVCQPHYLARSERSFSPVLRRGASFSRPGRMSESRSRSRSPITWHLPRERNMGVRRLSRSPDFRSEDRMERIHMPLRKPNFGADNEDVFMSPPRSRFSPPCYSRWSNDRKFVAARFRERKSPGRLFGQSKKFNPVWSPRRMNSDDYFRSMIHPGRFTEHGASRVPKYDDSDYDRTKHGDRSEMFHRVNRCDTSSVVRRFRFDAEDCFEAHNTRNEDSCIKDTARRDAPRSASGTRAPFRYNNKKDLCPQVIWNRGYNEDASPRRA